MRKRFLVDGNKFDNLEGFYSEMSKLLTKGLDWEIHSLDGFNDILRGGFGVHEDEPILLIWKNFKKSTSDFGYEATVKYYEKMITRCHPANIPHVQSQLNAAKNKTGKTLMDIIVEIIINTDNSGHDCQLETVTEESS
jgi:hypothetical protein